jgi:hypothetical protein
MDGSGYPPAPRDAGGRFVAGNPGRRLGARSRVSKRAALTILRHFETNQDKVLERSLRWFLPQYLALISRLLPRQTEEAGGLELESLSREEALALVAAVRAAADRFEAGEGSIEALEMALMGVGEGVE